MENQIVSNNRYRIITLTDRAPVKIKETDWPIIAKADWHDGGQIESQANRRASVRVREHADGRRLVYSVVTSTWPGERDRRAGILMSKPEDQYGSEDTVNAIRTVTRAIGYEVVLSSECIAELPAEVI